MVVSDEIYEKILYDDARHLSIASLPGMRDRTVTINGFSKSYSMTGWRLGYAAASVELMSALIRVHQYTTVCATSFAQVGAVAALNGPQECVEQMVAEFARRRRLVVDSLKAMPGVTCAVPDGAFYVFPSFKQLGMSSQEVSQSLLNDAFVVTVPGSDFGGYGEGHVRMAYSNSYEKLEEAMERVASWVSSRV
jgi:aspartate/methionine/tyrosine aminotransferase